MAAKMSIGAPTVTAGKSSSIIREITKSILVSSTVNAKNITVRTIIRRLTEDIPLTKISNFFQKTEVEITAK